MSQGVVRIAFLTNIPSPYRAEMVRAWARCNPELAITVFYTDPDDQGRGWAAGPIGCEVGEERLPVIASFGRYGKLNRGLGAMVRSHDVIVIGGFEQASYLAAAGLAKLAGRPVILLTDGFSPARFGTEPAPILALKRLTAKLADTFFANGTVGERYLREQIRISANRPVYNQYLSHNDHPIRQALQSAEGLDKEQIRRELGIDAGGRRVVVTCGYLIERKRIDLIIDAIARIPQAERPLLLVVGDGELKPALRAQAGRMEVPVHFAGFRLGHELATFYLAADMLVLASSDDPWGLVVNEAMAAGLPVVASDACGVALDLVRDGVNGYVFRTGDVGDLAGRLEKMLRADLAAMGRASRALVSQWTPDHSAQSLGRAVAETMRKRHGE